MNEASKPEEKYGGYAVTVIVKLNDVEAIPSVAVKVITCVPTSVIVIGDTVNKSLRALTDIVTEGEF